LIDRWFFGSSTEEKWLGGDAVSTINRWPFDNGMVLVVVWTSQDSVDLRFQGGQLSIY
jgi:hypothetical protein